MLAEKDWDGPAIKKAVIQNQRDRKVIRSVKGDGITPNWNFAPVETGPYDPLSDFTAKGPKS